MKILSLILFLTLICSVGFSQSINSTNIDSLKSELSKTKSDTTKVLIYSQLAANSTKLLRKEKIEFGWKGYTLAKKIRFEKGIITCGHNLAFQMAATDFFKALPILFETKRISEKNNDTTNLAISYGYIGFIYNHFDTKKAIDYYRICLKLMNEKKISEENFPINTAIAYGFKDNGDLDSALIYLQKGYESGLKGISKISILSYDLQFGQIYYAKGNVDLALQYFKKSISHTNEGTVGEAFYYLAKIYKEQNKLDSAKYFAKKSLMYEQKFGRNTRIISSSQILYDLYKSSNPKEALHYLEISSATKDSLFNQEKARQIEKLSFEELQRQAINQRRMEARQLEYENKIKLYILIGVLIGLGILTFIQYRNNQKKQQANTLLQEKKQEIEKTLLQLKSTQAQLIQSEKLASLGELTAGIAHEIQNPLNFVNNFSELSVELIEELKSPLTPKGGIVEAELLSDITQNLEKISLHGKRASSIVKGMLEHSRSSTGEKELTDINALADEYLRLAYHGLRAKDKNFNADFKTELDPNLPKIAVIPQDIGRVLLNLINNAFYAVQDVEKPMVIVSSEKSENQIIIKVKDNGKGIPKANLEKIFQPFFTTKPTGQGTGLGLSLAYDIVTKGHGGSIECVSIEGEGTTFLVKLPV